MKELADLHGQRYRQSLYDHGLAVAFGVNAPKELRTLLIDPVRKMNRVVEAHGPIRIPKKKAPSG
jgi:hypothetical protein